MTTEAETSDAGLLDLLVMQGPLSVSQMAQQTKVTATAVRQRLGRLLARGDVQRTTQRSGRGRPQHRYCLTEKGRRRTGTNFGDLAIALWQEVRQIKDTEIRRGLLQRLSQRMATQYAGQIHGDSLDERMDSLVEVFRERQVPFAVDRSGELPILTALACPYPELAEQDRTVCSMERIMFSELLGENVHLSNCRLDGERADGSRCCTFEPANRGANINQALPAEAAG
jgi:predicted ArsR family transcriptional regulator